MARTVHVKLKPNASAEGWVTKRDMDDARRLGERSGLNMSDDWDEFVHDVAQAIADGRRPDND